MVLGNPRAYWKGEDRLRFFLKMYCGKKGLNITDWAPLDGDLEDNSKALVAGHGGLLDEHGKLFCTYTWDEENNPTFIFYGEKAEEYTANQQKMKEEVILLATPPDPFGGEDDIP